MLTLYAGYQALPTNLQERQAELARVGELGANEPRFISLATAAHAWGMEEATAQETLDKLVDTSWLHGTTDDNYILQPFVQELIVTLGDLQAQQEMLSSYRAVIGLV